jgi:hypothetical protein
MKNYLLKPHKRLQICKSNIWVIKCGGLNECWRFIKDKYFLCIHFLYDNEKLLKNLDPKDLTDKAKIEQYIIDSDVCLGILTKRGNASIKSMLKVYKMDKEYNDFIKNNSNAKST